MHGWLGGDEVEDLPTKGTKKHERSFTLSRKAAKEVGLKVTRHGASAGPTSKSMFSYFANCRSGFTPRLSRSGSDGKRIIAG
jgi:hypothetical protein